MATKTNGGDPQDSDLKGEETVMHFFGADTGLCPEFTGGLVDPKAVNVIHATIDPQKKDMMRPVQIASHRHHVNCIRGKRQRVEESSSESSITFTDDDLEGVDQPHNDALVISLKIDCQLVDKILVDPGSACNVMFMNLFEMLKPKDVKETSTLMYGFDGTEVQPLGVVFLPICLEPVIESTETEFLVVDVKSASYNAIIGRPFLHKTKAVASTFHQLVKFHPIMGIEAIRGDQKVSRECCMIEVKAKEKAVKPVATSGIVDGCMRSDSGPIVGDDFAELAEEVEELDYLVLVGAVSNPKKPFAAIVGGSKVSSKIGVIKSLLEKVDMPLLGGGKIFTSYKAQGYSVGSSLAEVDKLDLATSLLEKAKSKWVVLMLPTDVVVADKVAADANSKVVLASGIPGDWTGFDIGPDSIKTFGEALDSTNTIIWNGPTGVFVFDKFAVGTKGRPKGVTPKYSLKPLVPRQYELLGIKVKMVNDWIGVEVQIMVAEIPGGVLLLENVRFYKEEEKNDPEFAKKLASLEFLYTNDAFGTAHRAHASTEGVAKY